MEAAELWLACSSYTPPTCRHSGVDVGVILGVAGGVLLLVTLTGLFIAGQGRVICMAQLCWYCV